MNLDYVDYKNYLLEYFRIPLNIMRNLQLTEDELLKLDISKDGFDLNKLTELMFNRYAKDNNTSFEIKDNILWVKCPYENNEFKTNIIRYLSNFPTYELKFI